MNAANPYKNGVTNCMQLSYLDVHWAKEQFRNLKPL